MIRYAHYTLPLRFIQVCFKSLLEVLFIRAKPENPAMMYSPTDRNILFKKAISRFYIPSVWAPGPWSQTLANIFFFGRSTHKYTHRESFMFKDGVICYLDWKENMMHHDFSSPIIVICHGCAGDLNSSFCQKLSDYALESGYRAVVYNRRGHAGAPIYPIKQTIYPCKGYPIHADIEDMAEVSQHIHNNYPNAPMFLAGTSAGANMLLKYIGENKGNHPYRALFAESSPYDVYKMSHKLKTSMPPESDAMLAFCLLEMLNKRRGMLEVLCKRSNITIDVDQPFKSTGEIEEAVVLPFYKNKYTDIKDYYEKNGSITLLSRIDVPTLLLNSKADPMIDKSAIKQAVHASLQNDNIISMTTDQGGHSAWLSGFKVWSWDAKLCVDFFTSALASLYIKT